MQILKLATGFFSLNKLALISGTLLFLLGYCLYHFPLKIFMYFVFLDLFLVALSAFCFSLAYIGLRNDWDILALAYPVGGLSCMALLGCLFMTVISIGEDAVQDSYDKAVNSEIAALNSWLNEFPEPQDNSLFTPPNKLSGEYLEYATGLYVDNLAHPDSTSNYSTSYSAREINYIPLKEHSSFIHVVPYTYDNCGSNDLYTQHDTAEYIVVLHAYAEYQTSTKIRPVSIDSLGNKIPDAPQDTPQQARAMETKASSVMVTIINRKNKTIIARRDFPQPSQWIDNNKGTVFNNKLAEVETWLNELGIQENKWLTRGQLKRF